MDMLNALDIRYMDCYPGLACQQRMAQVEFYQYFVSPLDISTTRIKKDSLYIDWPARSRVHSRLKDTRHLDQQTSKENDQNTIGPCAAIDVQVTRPCVKVPLSVADPRCQTK